MPTVKELIEDMRRHLKVEIVPTRKWAEALKGLHRGGSPFQTLHVGDRFLISKSEISKPEVVAHEWGHMITWLDAGKPGDKDFGCSLYELIADDLERETCGIELALRVRWGMSFEDAKRTFLHIYCYEDDLEWEDDVGFVGGDELVRDVLAQGESRIKEWEASR